MFTFSSTGTLMFLFTNQAQVSLCPLGTLLAHTVHADNSTLSPGLALWANISFVTLYSLIPLGPLGPGGPFLSLVSLRAVGPIYSGWSRFSFRTCVFLKGVHFISFYKFMKNNPFQIRFVHRSETDFIAIDVQVLTFGEGS